MEIINPFNDGKQGNSRERLAKVEDRLERLEAVLNVHMAMFELQRKFFTDVTMAISENLKKKDDIKKV